MWDQVLELFNSPAPSESHHFYLSSLTWTKFKLYLFPITLNQVLSFLRTVSIWKVMTTVLVLRQGIISNKIIESTLIVILWECTITPRKVKIWAWSRVHHYVWPILILVGRVGKARESVHVLSCIWKTKCKRPGHSLFLNICIIVNYQVRLIIYNNSVSKSSKFQFLITQIL